MMSKGVQSPLESKSNNKNKPFIIMKSTKQLTVPKTMNLHTQKRKESVKEAPKTVQEVMTEQKQKYCEDKKIFDNSKEKNKTNDSFKYQLETTESGQSGLQSEVKNYEKFLNDLEIRYGLESKQEI